MPPLAVIDVTRAPDEPAQIAFDRVSRRVKRLILAGYSCKLPFRSIRPGEFALEVLPARGGWKITVSPANGCDAQLEEVLA